MAEDLHFLTAIDPETVRPDFKAAAAHALAYVEATLGPDAVPEGRAVTWCIGGRGQGRVIAVPKHRPNDSLNGYCSGDGELFVRIDVVTVPDWIARTTAHEAIHRRQFRRPGHGRTADAADEKEAQAFTTRYWLLNWVSNGAEILARMDARRAALEP